MVNLLQSGILWAILGTLAAIASTGISVWIIERNREGTYKQFDSWVKKITGTDYSGPSSPEFVDRAVGEFLRWLNKYEMYLSQWSTRQKFMTWLSEGDNGYMIRDYNSFQLVIA